MAEDRNALLGVLAIRKGWAQPAEVLAAQQALGVHKDRDLAQELVDAKALTLERARELEALADKAMKEAGGDAGRAIAANGGMDVISASKSASFGDDDDDEPPRMAAPDFGDHDDEGPRVAPQGKDAPKTASLDEEDEPTKVLDWERATRKSIETAVADPVPPRKK